MRRPQKVWDSWTVLIATEEGIRRVIRLHRKYARRLLMLGVGAGVLLLAFFARWVYVEHQYQRLVNVRLLRKQIEQVEKYLKMEKERAEEVEKRLQVLEEKLGTEEKQILPPRPAPNGIRETFYLPQQGKELHALWEILDQRVSLVAEEFSRREQQLEFIPSIFPLEGGYISSGFGWRNDPVSGETSFHRGIDISPTSSEAVRATASGVVLHAGWTSGMGNLIVISHGNGWKTYYAHNSRLYVQKGDKVKKGQVIARVGRSGKTTAIHLHYEVHFRDRPVNPRHFLSLSPWDVGLIEKKYGVVKYAQEN
ncbi:MAG: peptidoglycan DD-metalloendopeptidase family protein [bacterium JZ-2024 1]